MILHKPKIAFVRPHGVGHRLHTHISLTNIYQRRMMIGWGFRGPSFDGPRKANLEILRGSARCYFWVTTMIIGVPRVPKTERREKQPLHLQRLLQTLQTP